MNNKFNSINSNPENSSIKYNQFLKNTKEAVRKTLTTVGITVSSILPTSINTVSTVSPLAATSVTIGTAASLLTACSSSYGPEEIQDITPPTINVSQSELDITGGKEIRISGNQLYIGDVFIASWKDDMTKNCKVELSLNGKSIASGTTLSEEGTLNIKISDSAGNVKNTNITLIITNAPKITVDKYEVTIAGGEKINVSENELMLGDEIIASWKDDSGKDCSVSLKFNGQPIKSGDTVDGAGKLSITVTNKKGKSSSTEITIIMANAPEITVDKDEINIFGGEKINVSENKLMIGDEVIASWKDDSGKDCSVSLKFNGQPVKSGDTIDGAGKLSIIVTNEKGKSSCAEITITNDSIYGLEVLKNASLKVDEEINLLEGITFAKGVELVKVDIEVDGKRTTISDPSHYIPEYPGTCSIIFTIKGKNGENNETKIDNLTIKPLEHKSIEVSNIRPVDILPIVGQIETGDKKCYEHIEHLRIAEATRIRDMMWKYGTGNHSAEEYQQLMMRLNTGMLGENPIGYTNYEAVGGNPADEPSNHAHVERFTLNTLINHANFKVINPGYEDIYDVLYRLCKSDPNKINIMGISIGSDVDREQYNTWSLEEVKEYDKEKNRLIFAAGTNIRTKNGIRKYKIYQENYDLPDEHSVYSSVSRAHNKTDRTLNRHLMVTFGTDQDGDIDQTGEERESSKFPVGFHSKILFSGRTFPYRKYEGDKIRGATGKYNTSFTNYLNVAIADLCFQMFADVKDVDELLEMIRSTSLTDYIRLDGQTQELQLMNPAGFFKRYLMPENLPLNIQSSQTTNLNKGYYKGIIFDVPGAEVKINGEWIAYDNTNKSLIKNQNPMTLEWRINGKICRKLGYKGKNIKGKIIVVDDKWNGLNIDKDFSLFIE